MAYISQEGEDMKKQFILEIEGTQEEIDNMFDIAYSHLEREQDIAKTQFILEDKKNVLDQIHVQECEDELVFTTNDRKAAIILEKHLEFAAINVSEYCNEINGFHWQAQLKNKN